MLRDVFVEVELDQFDPGPLLSLLQFLEKILANVFEGVADGKTLKALKNFAFQNDSFELGKINFTGKVLGLVLEHLFELMFQFFLVCL